MRRAVIATAGTVVALVALLDYKSSSGLHASNVAVGTGSATPSPTAGATGSSATTSPATTSPATTSPAATSPASTATTAPATTTAPASRTGTGTEVTYRYGTIEVQVTEQNGRITAIRIPEETANDPRSESINSQAVPILTAEALKAQSLNFDVVSGATYTSDAFAQSLQAALRQVEG